MKIPVLNDLHEREGARMVEFAGWRMPVSFTSILKEALAVRSAAGLFDVTHMGRLEISGADALASLQRLTSNDLSKLTDFRGQYTLLTNERGGVVDDTIFYRRDAERFYAVVNASNTSKDIAWIRGHLEGHAALEDLTDASALFALQGPKSVEILSRMGLAQAGEIKRFRYRLLEWEGTTLGAARTGYTGEDGFEIACTKDDAEKVWTAILEAGKPFDIARCGLGARDVLRIEAGLPLYGHEIDDNISPVEAGLMRFVKMEKPEFVGKEAIEEKLRYPLVRQLFGITAMGRVVPRTGDVVTKDGEEIGEVTSGTWSPTLDKGIAMAFVSPELVSPGDAVDIISRGKTERAAVTGLPHYTRG